MLLYRKGWFPLSEKLKKGQFLASHPYGLHQKWLQILRRTTRGHVAIEYLKKKAKFRAKISHMSIFDVCVFVRGYLLTSCDIFETVPNFATLEEMVFEKVPGCTSKLCNHLFAILCRKREKEGLFIKFWWEICLKLWSFCPEILEKGIFGTNQAKKSIKMAWFPEEWVRICVNENVECSDKIGFLSLDTPLFWNIGQNMDFCPQLFEIDIE